MSVRIYNFLAGLTLLAGFLLVGCEVEDDGAFTQPVIFVDDTPVDTSFTVEDPCLTSSCALNSISVDAGSAELTLEFYNSFDILRPDAKWGTIKSAIIVVHGNNRNANEYFNWMSNAVTSALKANETVIIAPQFKTRSDVGSSADLIYWSSDGWKRGFGSNNITSTKFSSYDLVDTMMTILANKERFPFMEEIIVTGHSAGAQFTGLYAAASPVEDNLPDIVVNYVVANAQYFFYPGPERFDKGSNQFTIPQGCANYTDWPYGTDDPTTYLSRFNAAEIQNRYINRKVTFLLGTLDIFTSGTLNTTDCEANLLGDNRFDRGEKMFDYIQAFHGDTNNHRKELVNNVGHDAAQMYNSNAFVSLLKELLE